MSIHLENIIKKHNQTCNLQVVFIDIEKYSKRRTSSQVNVINAFTKELQETINEVARLYIDFIQKNSINFLEDIIIIPTGDGAAINFSFEGLHDIHLKFSEIFLKNLYRHNIENNSCNKFETEGWCNCHDKFNVRIGVAEGKAIVYKDVNNNFNVAGNVINTASRLIGEAERNQILFDETSYNQLIDLGEDPNLSDKFLELKNVEVKHNVILNLYLFNPNIHYINSSLPMRYIKKTQMNEIAERMKGIGMPAFFGTGAMDNIDKKEMLSVMRAALEMVETSELFRFDADSENPPKDVTRLEIPVEKEIKKTRRSKKS